MKRKKKKEEDTAQMVKRLLSKHGKPQLDPQNLHKRLGMVTWSVTSHGGGRYADPRSLLTSNEPISDCQIAYLKIR